MASADILFMSNHLRGQKAAAGTRSWQQTKHLSQDWTVDVVVPEIDPVTSQTVTPETYEGLNMDQVTVRLAKCIDNNRANKLRRAMFYGYAAIGQFRNGLRTRRPKVVLSMSLPVTTIFSAWAISRLRGVPLVVDVRDLPFDLASELGYLRSRLFVGVMRWIETFCLKRAAAVVCVSPHYVRHLAARGVPEDRLHFLPIGYDDFPAPDAADVTAMRAQLLAEFKGTPPRLLCIYCGTLGFVFGVDSILEAADDLKSTHPDVGFVFVGSGQLLEEYRETAARQNLNAVFLGRRPKEEIPLICRAGDLCIHAAKDGVFSAAMLGNKVFDYLGAGRLVIYSGPDGAVSEVLDELDAGLKSPAGDSAGLAENIARIARDPDVRDRLEEGGRGFRAAGYTAQTSAARLSEIVKEVISRS